jgi:hypothetical protein
MGLFFFFGGFASNMLRNKKRFDRDKESLLAVPITQLVLQEGPIHTSQILVSLFTVMISVIIKNTKSIRFNYDNSVT